MIFFSLYHMYLGASEFNPACHYGIYTNHFLGVRLSTQSHEPKGFECNDNDYNKMLYGT